MKKKKNVFPPSVQVQLFNYLKPEQQMMMRTILRVIKKPAQKELCYSLLDYLETGTINMPNDFTLCSLFLYATRVDGDLPNDPEDRRILRPLNTNH